VLRDENGQWAIDDVICQEDEPGAAEQPPLDDGQVADWQLLQDDEYGFRLRYPTDWTREEIEIDSSGDDIPIKRVVALSPQDWAGRAPLATVEVGVGNLEELSMWPVSDKDQSDATTINGYTVLVGEGAYGELFYVFEHPQNRDLRVAVRDQTGGEDELREVVDGILSSFGFTE
jgi:hypothetical protein